MDSGCDVASVLCAFIANCIDVAIDSAAAIFHCIAEFIDTLASSIEAIADAGCDATELSVYILVVKAFEKVGTCDCALCCSIASAAKNSTAAKYCEPYKINEPFVTG